MPESELERLRRESDERRFYDAEIEKARDAGIGISTSIRLWPDRARGPWHVHTYWTNVAGRAECVGVAVFGGADHHYSDWLTPRGKRHQLQPVTTEAWRSIPFGRLIAETRASVQSSVPFMQEAAEADAASLGRRPSKEHLAWIAMWSEDNDKLDVRGWPKGHLRAVAQVYIDAWRGPNGSAPTKAVAEHFQTSKTAAAKWVARCRELGLLEETTRGRPGGATPKRRTGRRTT